MASDNTTLLWAFCAAARHAETCASWQEHRELLDTEAEYIQKLIEAIPNAIAVGKASQKAAEQGQDTLIGNRPKSVPIINVKEEDNKSAVKVQWRWDDEAEVWRTENTIIPPFSRVQEFKPDCRKVTALAYKPREVLLYFDWEPDEWNATR